MTRSCSRIALIERPINEPIEKHRCRAGKYHTNNHQEQNSPRGPAVCCHNQRSKRKWQRKDRMRKTNQPQKPRHWPAESDLLISSHRKEPLQKVTKKTKFGIWIGNRFSSLPLFPSVRLFYLGVRPLSSKARNFSLAP